MGDNSISIIIPCFNGWKFFSKCLESLEHQAIKPEQVIIGDDCSTDGSYEKILEYKNSSSLNLTTFQNKENSGPGATRNAALQYVKTEFVAFCDCDDWYETCFIAEMKKTIMNNESIDLIIYDNYVVNEGVKIQENSTKMISGYEKKELIALYKMSLWRMLVRTSIVKSVYFPPLYNGEDGAVAPQIIEKADKIKILHKAYYNYLYRSDSVSFSTSPQVYKSLVQANDVIEKKIGNVYNHEKEFLGIKMVCYGATLNALKARIRTREVKHFLNDFKKRYPNWIHNDYIHSLGITKIIFLRCVFRNSLLIPRIMSLSHDVVVKRRKK